MKRDSFLFYRSFMEAVESLPPESYKAVLVAISNYALNGEIPKLTGIEKTIFLLVKPQVDANNRKYENALRGGRKPKDQQEDPEIPEEEEKTEPEGKPNQEQTEQEPSGNQEETKSKARKNQETTNSQPNDNVNVNVNENEKENAKDNAGQGPPRVLVPRYPRLNWEDVLSAWSKIPGVPLPGDLYRFTAKHGRDILPLLDGLKAGSYLGAIQNYELVRKLPKTWWKANPDIVTWTRKYLDRFLPENFNLSEYCTDSESKEDKTFWDEVRAEVNEG